MQLIMLKSKLHHARVTQVELEYEGSCAIDEELMQAAQILQNEQLHIYNLDNGERFVTYAIKAPFGSGMISLNGAAAHKAKIGHRVIICTYANFMAHELENYQPRVVVLNTHNQIKSEIIEHA